jgi:hypothetical protein
MYAKLFGKILDSSIWEESLETRVIWLTLLAAMDETGYCPFASALNLARRANVDISSTEAAIGVLEGPDPNSSDSDNEGRRLERVPGGWIVLNAAKYREIAKRKDSIEKNRLRVAKHRESKATTTPVKKMTRNDW